MAPVLHRQLERLQVVIDQSQLLSSYIQFMNGRAVERAVILDLTGFGDRIFGKYGYIEFERTGGSDRDNGAIPIHLQGIGDLLIRQKFLEVPTAYSCRHTISAPEFAIYRMIGFGASSVWPL